MTDASLPIPSTPAWQALARHRRELSGLHLRELFRADPGRYSRYSLEAGPLFLDYSKNRIVDDTLRLLCGLAHEAGVPRAVEALRSGERVNVTEGRAALHTALREREGAAVVVDGEDVMPAVRAVLGRMRRFCEGLHGGPYRGYTGRAIKDLVNIGIGGSHLGPCMVTRALAPYRIAGLATHFVSNVDATDLHETLERLDPETTLFIIASKTFTTLETMTNARSARDWFLAHGGTPAAIDRHFVAVSTNLPATRAFGIRDGNVFEFWDWVGGRYSLWSAIGLSIALGLGMDRFEALLAGAREMDRHFRDAPLERNAPVILALLGIWYRNFYGAETHAVVPYDQHLELLPAYLQQLVMESNGKRVTAAGAPVACATAPILWGATGTNGQHAFFQLLHQGTALVPVDFLVGLRGRYPLAGHHELLYANCLAQSEALMRGKTEDEARAELAASGLAPEAVDRLAPHKVFPGNKPSNTILYETLTPEALGALIALYEHKTFVEAQIWGINPFDQWGVELGKELAGTLVRDLRGESAPGEHDASTLGLLQRYRQAAG